MTSTAAVDTITTAVDVIFLLNRKWVKVMSTFRFDLNEEYSKKLEDSAAAKRMNIQEYIRFKLFDETTIFSVDEVIKRIQAGGFVGKEFTVPDVFSDEEWSQIDRGNAGVLGKNFYNLINDNPGLGIRFVKDKTIKRRAVYIYMKG